MRISVIHQYFLGKGDAGGSRWNQFAKYWAEAGHDVTVLAGMVHYAKGTKAAQYKGRFVVRKQPQPGVTVCRRHVSEAYNRIGRVGETRFSAVADAPIDSQCKEESSRGEIPWYRRRRRLTFRS